MTLLITVLVVFQRFLEVIIFINVLLSWLPGLQKSWFAKVIYTLTDPILMPIRALMQKSPLGGAGMVLDFSPIIAIILIDTIMGFIISVLVKTL